MSFEEVTIGECRLIRGDCYALFDHLQPDCVLTDPPFSSVTHQGARGGGFGKNRLIAFASLDEEQAVFLAQTLVHCTRRWIVMTMDWRHAAAIERTSPAIFVRAGIWVKPNGAPQFTGDRPGTGWESVVMLHRPGSKQWNGGGHHAVWHIPKIEGQHPTEKPLPLLLAWVEQFTRPGETILDPFMGTGVTGLACLKRGRAFIGIEQDPHYFDLACRRLRTEYAQGNLFLPSPSPRPRQEVLL
jgi:site-specific DNA-methyltransferase (adenine-specific)